MSLRRALVPLVLLGVLGLPGCDRGTPPAAGAASPSADPLAGIEASVDAIGRDLDADADADR